MIVPTSFLSVLSLTVLVSLTMFAWEITAWLSVGDFPKWLAPPPNKRKRVAVMILGVLAYFAQGLFYILGSVLFVVLGIALAIRDVLFYGTLFELGEAKGFHRFGAFLKLFSKDVLWEGAVYATFSGLAGIIMLAPVLEAAGRLPEELMFHQPYALWPWAPLVGPETLLTAWLVTCVFTLLFSRACWRAMDSGEPDNVPLAVESGIFCVGFWCIFLLLTGVHRAGSWVGAALITLGLFVALYLAHLIARPRGIKFQPHPG